MKWRCVGIETVNALISKRFFRSALRFRVDSGDKVSSLLVESLCNAQYTSSEVLNKMIHCISTHIREQLKTKDSGIFPAQQYLTRQRTPGMSIKLQSSFKVWTRMVPSPKTSLDSLKHFEQLGKGLIIFLLTKLKEMDLDVLQCHGQG